MNREPDISNTRAGKTPSTRVIPHHNRKPQGTPMRRLMQRRQRRRWRRIANDRR